MTIAWLLMAAALLPAANRQPPAEADPTLEFVSPRADAYVSGPTMLEARIAPDTVRVRRVVFHANGLAVCTLETPPWRCEWDAGRNVQEHRLRLVAELADGRRLTRALRTRKLDYAETVDVDAIQVTALVSDRSGRFVRGLRREQFRLQEDGVAQPITAFGAEELPLEAVVAVDISGSMSSAITDVKGAVKRFLQALRAGDAVTVVGFNDAVFTVARREVQPAARARAVDRLAPWGETALHDAGLKALEMLSGHAGRKALVVFTDGDDNASLATREMLDQELRSSNVVLYAVGLGRAIEKANLQRHLEQLASESGGRAIFASNLSDLDKAFAAIVEELANQYLLTYVPPRDAPDGQWHRIGVDLVDLPHAVRAREGYLSRRSRTR
jgi:Ca-activated chloride channel family protein